MRQTFANFSDERDAARLAQLAERARADAQWVLRKYRKPGAADSDPAAAAAGKGQRQQGAT